MENKNNHFIVGVGASEKELVYANPFECNNYCEIMKQKALIFTPKSPAKHKYDKSIKCISYLLVGNVKKPVSMVVNKKGLDLLTALKEVLESVSDCLVIVDCENNPDELIDLLDEYREKNNIDVIININSFHLFTDKLMKRYTSLKIHGTNQVEATQPVCEELIEGFGEHDGMGVFLTSQLVKHYQKHYVEFCKRHDKDKDPKMYSVPFYYNGGSINITKEVYQNLIEDVLKDLPFDESAEEYMKIYKIK